MSDDNANTNVQTIATHTSGDGTVTAIEETVTTLVDNGDGTFTYTSEDGTQTTYDETTTTIALSTDNQTIEYIDENGVQTDLNLCAAVDSCETVTSLTFNTVNNELIYLDENGTSNVISLGDLVSVVTDDNANTNVQTIATHTSGDGTVTAIEETVTTLVDNGDGTFTYTSEDGTQTTYDETTTTIALSTDNQTIEYIDENGVQTDLNLCAAVDSCETVTSLTFNTVNNELIYLDENGTSNVISLGDLVSVVTDDNANTNVQTIATHTSGDGTVTAIEETVTTLVDNGDGTFTYTSEDGTQTTYDETTTTIALSTDNQTIEYIDENGVQTDLNLCAAVDSCETVTSLTFNTVNNELDLP